MIVILSKKSLPATVTGFGQGMMKKMMELRGPNYVMGVFSPQCTLLSRSSRSFTSLAFRA